MSAVVEQRAQAPLRLPLLGQADPARVIAWRDGQAVDVASFLADVAAIAATLPEAGCAINLCGNRYAFLAAFCAVASRGQVNLLPATRTPQAIAETLAQHAGAYTLGETGSAATHLLPPLGGNPAAAMPLLEAVQLVAIGYTSGSTGQPRANPKSWRSLHSGEAHNIAALLHVLGLAEGQLAHIVATVPPQHMYGLELSSLLPLLGPFAVHAGHPLFPADLAAALAQVPAPRMLVTTPVHLRALLASAIPLPAIAAIVSATAPLDMALAAQAEAQLRAPLLELFGSTETCVIAQRRTAREDHWQLYSDVSLRPQPDGTLIQAPWLDAPTALQDLVEVLPGERFRLCGRHADLIEIAGKRASLADLTRRLLALAGVEDAALVQLEHPDSMGVHRIAALVVAPTRSEADLLEQLREVVDAAFLPRPLRIVSTLPRNATGKLPRAALLAALKAGGA